MKTKGCISRIATPFGQLSGHDMPPNPHDDAAETARYCAQICRELRDLASNNELNFLAYLLEMAREEAFDRHAELEGRARVEEP